MSNGSHKITEDTFKIGSLYINTPSKSHHTKSSSKISGGSRLGSATFLGTNEPMYDTKNQASDMLFLKFEDGVARPQIGGGHSLSSAFQKAIMSYINDMLVYHDMKASADIKEKMKNIVVFQIKCLFDDITRLKIKTIKLRNVEKVMKQHNILHQHQKIKK
jgi:hypothetical protein